MKLYTIRHALNILIFILTIIQGLYIVVCEICLISSDDLSTWSSTINVSGDLHGHKNGESCIMVLLFWVIENSVLRFLRNGTETIWGLPESMLYVHDIFFWQLCLMWRSQEIILTSLNWRCKYWTCWSWDIKFKYLKLWEEGHMQSKVSNSFWIFFCIFMCIFQE